MTLNAHRRGDQKRTRHTRVWLDGVEVTDRCFYADGRRGVVRLYRVLTDGPESLKFIDPETGSLATEERRGHVRWGRAQHG